MAQIHNFRRPPRRGSPMRASTLAWLLFFGGSVLAWLLKVMGILSPGLADLAGMAAMVGGFWGLAGRHRG